jgi:hypothetical protein
MIVPPAQQPLPVADPEAFVLVSLGKQPHPEGEEAAVEEMVGKLPESVKVAICYVWVPWTRFDTGRALLSKWGFQIRYQLTQLTVREYRQEFLWFPPTNDPVLVGFRGGLPATEIEERGKERSGVVLPKMVVDRANKYFPEADIIHIEEST